MKKIATLTMLMFVSLSAVAESSKTVQIDFWPFRATLGSSAIQIESELSRVSKEACGSLDKVIRIEQVRLEMESDSSISVNPNGNPGSINEQDANFLLHEPRVTGQAVVVCRQ